MSNLAWVTLATNDSYGLGALVLAHSLRRANTAHPAVVLITPSVTEAMRNRLSAVFAEVITVNVLDSQDAAHLALLQRPELGITFTKIHCWTLTQYEKCVFLDADTLLVQNCDELFDREELSAAPDVGWPDCFNSGVFVYKPSQDTYAKLIKFAQERGSFDGGDQGLLNAFFADWAHGDINKHLPFLYNVTSAAFYSYIPALKHYGQDLKIIHFIGAAKPWLQQFNWESRSVDAPEHLSQFLQLWWDLFVGQVHPQLDTAMELAVDEEQAPIEVLEPPPENPPEDTQHHYEPEITAESEFPWHWPATSTQETENQESHVNMSEIHDPWKHCRGNIPPQQDYSSQYSNSEESQYNEEMRKYAWEHLQSYDNNTWQQTPQQEQNYEHYSDHTHHHDSHTQHHEYHSSHQGDYSHNDNNQNQNNNSHYHDQEHTYHEDQSHNQDSGHHWQDHFNNHSHKEGVHQPFQSIQHEAYHSQHNQSQHEHSSYEQNPDHSFQSYPSNNNFDQSYSQESHKHDNSNYHQKIDHSHGLNHPHSQSASSEHFEKHFESFSQHNGYRHTVPYTNRTNVEQVYHVYLDHHRPRRNQTYRRLDNAHPARSNGFANGHESESESEDEFIIPRHPYDGFFLRHKPTIDSRGRKICIHEIPPTPLPSPPAEEPSSRESSPLPSEDYDTASECEDQYSGVAGNLARVTVSSGTYQREAIDELTRRQGWEAGNIDYMGADSFDNIWAKISQTLNQQQPNQPSPPRKEPTPPKETVPAPAPVEAPTPASAPVEAPAPTPAPVEAPTPVPAAPEAPALVEAPAAPAPVETPVAPAPVEAPAAPAPVEAPVSTPAPVEAPTPALAPAAPPTPAPVPVEAPVAPAPVKAPVPVEAPAAAAAPAEAPALAPAPVEAPKEQAPQKTEPTVPPTPPATPKSSPEASSPVTEAAPEAPKASAPAPASPAPAAEAPAAVEPAQTAATPEKPQDASTTSSTDSPPLANTPSKEEAPAVSPTKSEERRKPVQKLQLHPPAGPDPCATPDSEMEDAATLAHAIIASELSTSVTAPTPSADVCSPPPLQEKRLSVEAPEAPSPPVSLAQIGVKPKGKPTTAAQIESSITEKVDPAPTAEAKPAAPQTPAEAPSTPQTPASPAPESPAPATPTSPTTPAPPGEKKKSVKKVSKKEAGSSGDVPTPVPPPRKKEKKPKEK